MKKFKASEQVTMYHPDKACDQISDTLLTEYLRLDPEAHCGIETLWKDNTVVVAGEVSSKVSVESAKIVRRVANKLGYQVGNVIDLISMQSPEIKLAVDSDADIGAGDQGIMFGYACRDTQSRLPYGFDLANRITEAIEEDVQREGSPLVGDAKTQVTVETHDGDTELNNILVSACHDPHFELYEVRQYIAQLLRDKLGIEENDTDLIVNPAGSWTIGGPTADCGLTGRKIVCDQYGGYCPVGGGAFSGKDPSKVDRSASYMARYLACKALEIYPSIDYCGIQLAYAIGLSQPVCVDVRTGVGIVDIDFAKRIRKDYDLSPRGIIDRLHLLDKDYGKIAEGCHYRIDGILKGEI